jgi:cytoskeleton protein RodZ
MTDITDTTNAHAGEPAQAVTGPVGSVLSGARAARGLTVEDVAGKLKFSLRQIESLEAGRVDELPGGTFLRGMVRSYARLVELDPAPLLARMASETRPPDDDRLVQRFSEPVPFSDSGRRVNVVYAVLSVSVLVIAGAVALEWGGSRSGTSAEVSAEAVRAESRQAPAPVRVEAAPDQGTSSSVSALDAAVDSNAEAARSPISPVQGEIAPAALTEPDRRAPGVKLVRLRFERDSWVQVVDGSGRVLMSRLNRRGTESVLEGREPLSFVIGNAQYVKMNYQGEAVDLAPHVKVEVARFTLP